MSRLSVFSAFAHCFRTLSLVAVDLVRLASLGAHSRSAPFALPSNQGIRLYIHQRIAPREHSAQAGHRPSGRVVGPTWFDRPLLEQRQLLAKEEILRSQGTRRILHQNVTAHPTAEWTLQQLREALPGEHRYRFVIHDRDSIFSAQLDQAMTDLGVKILRTPVRAPRANSVCERFGGTIRRECLDYLIPINERHLKLTIKEWILHYNRGRPHSSLGPGIPERNQDRVPVSDHRHKLPAGYYIGKKSVLGGLHQEYRLVKEVA
jgi:hypothetical protein